MRKLLMFVALAAAPLMFANPVVAAAPSTTKTFHATLTSTLSRAGFVGGNGIAWSFRGTARIPSLGRVRFSGEFDAEQNPCIHLCSRPGYDEVRILTLTLSSANGGTLVLYGLSRFFSPSGFVPYRPFRGDWGINHQLDTGRSTTCSGSGTYSISNLRPHAGTPVKITLSGSFASK